jgi:hypothetical protein
MWCFCQRRACPPGLSTDLEACFGKKGENVVPDLDAYILSVVLFDSTKFLIATCRIRTLAFVILPDFALRLRSDTLYTFHPSTECAR